MFLAFVFYFANKKQHIRGQPRLNESLSNKWQTINTNKTKDNIETKQTINDIKLTMEYL